jgi:Ca2+-binding EF-hand superfamily protein
MEAVPIEKLLEAFQVLDVEGKGFVTKDFMGYNNVQFIFLELFILYLFF